MGIRKQAAALVTAGMIGAGSLAGCQLHIGNEFTHVYVGNGQMTFHRGQTIATMQLWWTGAKPQHIAVNAYLEYLTSTAIGGKWMILAVKRSNSIPATAGQREVLTIDGTCVPFKHERIRVVAHVIANNGEHLTRRGYFPRRSGRPTYRCGDGPH